MFQHIWLLLIVPGLPFGMLLLWMHYTVRKRDRLSRRPFAEMSRPAGYSLQLQTDKLWEDISEQLMLCMLSGVVAWGISHLSGISIWLPLLLGLFTTSYFALRAQRLVGRLSNHRLGLLGEQVVGQILDQCAGDGTHVFHDLEIHEAGKSPWNIDHVVVSPAGVFAIETKTRRKPKSSASGGQQNHRIIFDGGQLHFPAPMQADRHGLAQAMRNAQWLADKLTAHTGSPIPVTPVLVFPGWWIDRKGKGAVSVLNAKELTNFIKGRTSTLPADRLGAIRAQLDERCRIDLSAPA